MSERSKKIDTPRFNEVPWSMRAHGSPSIRLRVLTALLCLAASVRSFADRPNILFIAVDDLRVDLGCYGSPDVKTPNIDRLAARSLLFNRAYCQQAVCNPSRASVLTGRRPDTLRIWNLATHFRERESDIVTLPQYFRQQGYFTRGIGKIFHNWRQKIEGDPVSWDVPSELHYNTHYADKPVVTGDLPANLVNVGTNECRDVPDEAYFDGRIAAKAVSVIAKLSKSQQPFFLGVGFWKPHLPFNAPQKYWDLFDRGQLTIVQRRQPPEDAPEIALHNGQELLRRLGRRPTTEDVYELRHGYVAAIAYLDAQIGKVMAALDASGAADSTIIVFWSDHGFHLGEHDLWCKTSNFELDARIPLLISVPGMKTDGQKTDALVELLDLYPTLVDYAGLPPMPRLEGSSLRPIIEGDQAHMRSAYTQHPRPAYYKGHVPEVMGYSVRSNQYRYTEWRNMRSARVVARELYDHETDPGETENVVARHAESAEKHARLLRDVFPDHHWTDAQVVAGQGGE